MNINLLKYGLYIPSVFLYTHINRIHSYCGKIPVDQTHSFSSAIIFSQTINFLFDFQLIELLLINRLSANTVSSGFDFNVGNLFASNWFIKFKQFYVFWHKQFQLIRCYEIQTKRWLGKHTVGVFVIHPPSKGVSVKIWNWISLYLAGILLINNLSDYPCFGSSFCYHSAKSYCVCVCWSIQSTVYCLSSRYYLLFNFIKPKFQTEHSNRTSI